MSAFDEVQFPPEISFHSTGGPMRQTQVVVLGSGAEQRNARWANSRRNYNIGFLNSDDELHAVIVFFEARNGKLIGFRFKDWGDYKSCSPQQTPSPLDQTLGTGPNTTFQLIKLYQSGSSSWTRQIKKPVSGTVRLAFNGVEQSSGSFTVDYTTGIVTCAPGATGVVVTAGFQFDTPVRFDTDKLEIQLGQPLASEAQSIPMIELLL